jgi:post-segregation antitoxin (ccd killing protein)
MKPKISITLDPEIYNDIRQQANKQGVPVSHLIEEAIKVWRKKKLGESLKEYYKEASSVHDRVVREAEPMIDEVWKEENEG